MVKKIMVATDQSHSATRAVDWAADMAGRFGAELHLLQVLVPEQQAGTEAGAAEATRATFAAAELGKFAQQIAGPRGKARVMVDTDPSRAIVRAAEEDALGSPLPMECLTIGDNRLLEDQTLCPTWN